MMKKTLAAALAASLILVPPAQAAAQVAAIAPVQTQAPIPFTVPIGALQIKNSLNLGQSPLGLGAGLPSVRTLAPALGAVPQQAMQSAAQPISAAATAKPVFTLKTPAAKKQIEALAQALPEKRKDNEQERSEALNQIFDSSRKAAAPISLEPVTVGGQGAQASGLSPSIIVGRSKPMKAGIPRPAMGVANKVVWGAVAAFAFRAALKVVFAGIAAGPATLLFKVYDGTLLFWSILQSITLHEVGHAWTAEKMGDVSPRMAGQLSPNPLRFTGPIGATVLMLTSLLGFPMGGFATNVQQAFGDPENKGAMGKVAIAGPLVNLALTALIGGLILGVRFLAPGLALMPWVGGTLRILSMTAAMNLMLGVMNLIPLGPLDGQKVLMGFIPQRYHKAVQAFTFFLGLGLLVLLMVWGLGTSTHRAVTQHGAGTPFGSTGDAYIMSLFINGLILWAFAVWPGIKKLAAMAKKWLADRKLVKAGGLSLLLALPVVEGKSPHGNVDHRRLVVPSSVAASDGEEFSISGLEGDRALLKGRDRSLTLPADLLGGAAKVLAMQETATVAEILGRGERGRRLLTPEETAAVLRVSHALGMPVYELEYLPTERYPGPALLADTENGRAFFIRYDVLHEAAGSEGRVDALITEMSGRLGIKPKPTTGGSILPLGASALVAEAPPQTEQVPDVKRYLSVGLVFSAIQLALELAVPFVGGMFGYVPHPNYAGAVHRAAAAAAPAANYIISALHGTVVAPILEEMIFRGGIMGFLTKVLGPELGKLAPWVSGLLSSILFVVLHETADPVFFAVRLIGSLMLSYAYHAEGIRAAMAQHALHNGFWQMLTLTRVFAGDSAVPFMQIILAAVYGLSSLALWRKLFPKEANQ